jgi:hypothetical protein
MRTIIRSSVLVALVATLISPTHSLAAPSRGGCASQWVEVYDVSLKTDAKSYSLGDTAVVTATVTHSITGTPVADADVTVGAIQDLSFVARSGRTDAAGVAKLGLSLSKRAMDVGWAELRALARTAYNQGDALCAGVSFYGFEQVKRAFRITR